MAENGQLTGTFRVKSGMAQMLKGGVIMDVINAEQARVAEESGAVAVMALERVPADIRAQGGVARMSDPEMIQGIQEAVSIPVMAKARIGHFVEAQVLEALEVDYVDESEVLTPADEAHHTASVMDRDGIKPLLKRAKDLFPRLSHLWLDAGYNGRGKGKDWVEKTLGLTAEVVRHPPKPRYVWVKEGEEPDWEKLQELLPPPGFRVLPRRWVVERTFSWIDQNRRMSKDYEKLAETGEAFVLVAMSRLMARRLARS